MLELLGSEAEALFAALQDPPRTGLRVNTLKGSLEDFKVLSPWPLTPLPWCPSGYRLDTSQALTPRPGQHPLHRAGVYYLQEPSAMAVAEAVAPQPGEWVLDLAAAPGGKTTHLAALMRGEGLLVANEVERGRVKALGENLERCGVPHALVTSEAVATLAARWGAAFDRVLLDAPCSGEGMFRKSEDARAMWSKDNVQRCASRQGGLLADAAALVKAGGTLLYSTCTFAPEENEEVVARFLQTHSDFALVPLVLPSSQPGRPDWTEFAVPGLEHTRRFWPHRAPGEGHFVARLGRTDGPHPPLQHATFSPPLREVRASWKAFVQDTLAEDPAVNHALTLIGDRLVALPGPVPITRGLRVLRTGLWLGTPKKGRFEPSHSLALALLPEQVEGALSLDLLPDDERLKRYLHGDVLDSPGDDGWLLITVSGFALGWGRRVKGTVKNFYPKGLRQQNRSLRLA